MAPRTSPASVKPRKRRQNASPTSPGATDANAQVDSTIEELVVDNWQGIAQRLGLSGPAADVGAVLLKAELDPTMGAGVMPEEPATRCLRRGNLIAKSGGTRAAAAGLVELERRSIVVQVSAGEWLSAEVALDARVRAACICGPSKSPRSATLDECAFPSRVRADLMAAFAAAKVDPRRYLVVVRGRAGSGRDTVAALFCEEVGASAARSTSDALRGAFDPLEPELSGAVAVWDAAGLDPSSEDVRRAAAWLGRSSTVAIALLDPDQDAPDIAERDVIVIEPEPVTLAERTEMWSRAIGRRLDTDGDVAARLASRNRAAAGLASRVVRSLAIEPAQNDELVASVERRLTALSRPSSLRGIVVEHPAVSLSRVIVQAPVADGLQRVIALARSGTLEGDRRGVKVMFAGASGTGKTLAARAIATELALPLFRVDLATVVSKWVGETEKNLRQAMDAAQSAGAVLLFDEGDALFAKRGEVQRGTDRYANMEASYLLQAFEVHDGVVIVTTNLMQNIDTAFVRRFDVCVHFQRPTASLRAVLWRQELGPAAADVSENFLSRTICSAEIPGGNIASAARLARALAAHRGSPRVSEDDLKTAVGSEFEKMGATVEAQRWYSPEKADARPG